MDFDLDAMQQPILDAWDSMVSYFSELDIIHIIAWSCLVLGIILVVVGLIIWP